MSYINDPYLRLAFRRDDRPLHGPSPSLAHNSGDYDFGLNINQRVHSLKYYHYHTFSCRKHESSKSARHNLDLMEATTLALGRSTSRGLGDFRQAGTGILCESTTLVKGHSGHGGVGVIVQQRVRGIDK